MVQSSSSSSVEVADAVAIGAEDVSCVVGDAPELDNTEDVGTATLLMPMVHSGSSSVVDAEGGELITAAEEAEVTVTAAGAVGALEGVALEARVLLPKRLASAPACCILAMALSCVSQVRLVPALATKGKATQMVPPEHGIGTHLLSTH